MMESTASLRGLTWQELDITAEAGLASELDVYLTSFQLGGWVVEAELPQLKWVVYLPCTGNWEECYSRLVQGLQELGAQIKQRRSLVDEDWANCWKQYYHPQRFGKQLVVCPSWEKFSAEAGDKVITLDPGMAFGTGAHATTAMCLEMLERVFSQEVKPEAVLDVGTGSGILAIAARLLGAGRIVASDSDPVAVKTAGENFQINGLNTDCEILQYVGVPQKWGAFPLVCANLVASLLVRLARPLSEVVEPQGQLVASGIVQERAEEVIDAFSQVGLQVKDRIDSGDWVCLLLAHS